MVHTYPIINTRIHPTLRQPVSPNPFLDRIRPRCHVLALLFPSFALQTTCRFFLITLLEKYLINHKQTNKETIVPPQRVVSLVLLCHETKRQQHSQH